MSISKTLLNNEQIQLAQGWLPLGSWPYAYDSNKGLLWYWQTYPNGLPVKGCTKLDPSQLQQLNQLA